MRIHMLPSRLKGFTLIELLVVVAIIALLLSILLPSLSGAREQAKTVKCGSNLAGIGRGMEMCKLENNGHTPTWDDGHPPETERQRFALTWADALFDNDYTNSTDIQICPTDQRPDEIMRVYGIDWDFQFVDEIGANEQPKWGMRTSYAISEISNYSFPGDRFKDAARQVHVVDGNWSWFINLNAYWHFSNRFPNVSSDPFFALEWGDPWVAWRHGQRHASNALFFDSHVAPIVPKVPKDSRRGMYLTVDTVESFTWLPGESTMRRFDQPYSGEVTDWINKREPECWTASTVRYDGVELRHPANYPFKKLHTGVRTWKNAWRKLPDRSEGRR